MLYGILNLIKNLLFISIAISKIGSFNGKDHRYSVSINLYDAPQIPIKSN